MHVTRPGCPRRAAGNAVSLALASGLCGCAESLPGTAAWIYISLATAAVAAASYLLGTLSARAALRRSRDEGRRWSRLQSDCTWETDASHRLVAWRAPGQLPGAAPDGLFSDGAAAAGLTAHLQAQQAFAGLRVRTAAARGGPAGWELRGVPREDDRGAFGGFIGGARPTDGDDALRAAAAALDPALDAHAAPAALLWLADGRWQLQRANASAAAQWPQALPGGDFDAALATLPMAVAQACRDLPPGSTATIEGWCLSALAGLPGDARSLLLQRQASAAAVPVAAPEANDGEASSFTLTHDLRAPVRVVEGFTRIVKEDYGRLLDRVGNDHLDRVLGAAARMNLMIDALMTLARLSSQPLVRQPVNLSQLAGWVVDDLRRGAPERASDIDIAPDLTVQGDPTLLRQVLENLLGNAWKYSARRERAHISFRRTTTDARTVYEVRDNGAGFDMRSAERLFGLFQRLHSASDFPGHGVGLASVRRIVRRHGGDIWAEAEPGRGAAFFFTLG